MSNIHYAPFLHTKRLTLRIFDEQKDVAFCTSIFGPSFTEDDFRRLIRGTCLHRSLLGGQKAPGASTYMIHLGTAEGPKVGVVSLCQRKEDIAPDIGWAVNNPEDRNKGIASEAAKECLRYWTEDFGLKEICAFTDRDNIASQKVAEHIGFVEKGSVNLIGPDGSIKDSMALGMRSMKDFQGESVNFWGEPDPEEERTEQDNFN